VYSARSRKDGERLRFGSSGLLYRSNKLMFDRDGFSLWNQLTGEPVLGLAARAPAAPLERLASSVATWGEWRRRHPATTAVRLDRRYGERWGFLYEPGAADRKRRGVRFPVWRQSALLSRDEEVFGLLRPGGAKAWPLARLLDAGVLEDVVATEPVVLVAEPGGRAVRAYARGRHHFRPGSSAGELLDAADRTWSVTESALAPPPASGEASLPRLPGSNALWFGWYGLVPHTELGGVGPASDAPPPAGAAGEPRPPG
jgi:hypothetical protein